MGLTTIYDRHMVTKLDWLSNYKLSSSGKTGSNNFDTELWGLIDICILLRTLFKPLDSHELLKIITAKFVQFNNYSSR